ncbi:hypothetical protein E2I17_06230 [Lactiplantibacillus plantarum]|uniref:hypothetical protein n=1 Tax=Lactiplantibacillus TaxID=2767842 RepID=UPI001058D8C2|nr:MULTISPECIES: hypothetical protein [Lactiplantibacillus]MDL2061539.1 hypothetical protein [Lactiplantibacillus paraplantarum]QIA84129.1 hypothetical protein FEE41_02270 [Lactiplantibacillus plantarum]QVG75309.1 hypothetical protein G9282_10605 [Lactiplantibacillus plantarum]TDH43661.1 hypothetical protein E2I17_06230 [Lactiplantibacillus plantarum]
MVKMINTKYGYVTPQEAEMDAHLDKWMKRRAKQHGAFSLGKNKEVQHEQIGNSSAKTQFNRQT